MKGAPALRLRGTLLAALALPASAQLPSTLGWYQIPNTQMTNVCPPGYNCANVIVPWSGGMADTTRNRLIVWGGGHSDYDGNEVYALNLGTSPITLRRLNNPSPPASSCVETLPDGTPPSRHTYDDLAYIAHADRMFSYTGSMAPTGCASNATWTLDMSNLQWTLSNLDSPHILNGGLAASDYDPNTKNVFIHTETYDQFASYNYDTNTLKLLAGGSSQYVNYNVTAVVDPKRRLFFMFGAGQAFKIDISGNDPAYALQAVAASGCAFTGVDAPGAAYDSVQDRIVGWSGGDAVYLYNPDTDSCSSVAYPNGPGAQQSLGTYGRLRYFPALNAFALVNAAGQNAYALRLTSGPASAPPAVGIAFPADGATVSGSLPIGGTAWDVVLISSVAVAVDNGAFAQATGTTSWAYSLDTAALSNGLHMITARATNGSGNNATAQISVTVSNSTSGGGGVPAAVGWHQLPNTNIRSLCPPYSDIQAVEGCKAVMADWSGGLFDTKRNRLIIQGGGHNGYFGNEIYAIDLNASPIARVLVKDASHGAAITNVTSCPEAYLDGTRTSRHSYSGQVYISSLDVYLNYGGSKSNCGFFAHDMWKFDPTALTWTQIALGAPQPNPSGDGSTPTMAYDPASNSVYLNQVNSGVFWKFDVNTNAFTQLRSGSGTNQPCPSLDVSADVDTFRDSYVCVGGGWLDKVSLAAPYTVTRLAATGCDALKSAPAPGWAYYPPGKTFVGWAGGDTVYIYDPATDSCATQTYPGGPTTIQGNGTYGRFRYSPASGVLIVANDIDSDAYSLRLASGALDTTAPTVAITSPASGATASGTISVAGTAADDVAVSNVQVSIDGGPYAAASGTTNWSFSLNTASLADGPHVLTAQATDSSNNAAVSGPISVTVSHSTRTASSDFQTRCKAPGVVKCVTWDNPSDFIPASGGGGYASGIYPAEDGAYEGIQDTATKVDGAGALKFMIRPGSVHPHGTLPAGYWLQQFGPDGAGTRFGEGTTFYMQFQVRLSPELLNYDWTQAGGQGWKVFIAWGPIPGPSCTGDQFVQENTYQRNIATGYTSCSAPALYTNNGNPPMDIEQGDYNCPYGSNYSTNPSCFSYPADTWLTEYWVVKIGTYGQPNTSFQAWIAPNGQPLKQFINLPNFTFGDAADHAAGLQGLQLTPYFSGANGSTTTPAAAMWFDDLIISTQPIAAPGASGVATDTTPPSVPAGLSAMAVSSSQIDLTWTASTDNVGVAGYKLFRGGAQVATPAATSYSDAGLPPATAYAYAVAAFDAAGNVSAQSAPASATTLSASSGTTGSSNFQARCGAPGVILCQGWDDPAVFKPATWPHSGLFGDSNGVIQGAMDTAVYASGGGSLRFTVPSFAAANGSGYWWQLMTPNLSDGPSQAAHFGPNLTFYVQYQQRFSPEFLTNVFPSPHYGGATSWKQSIFATDTSTCGNIELTTVKGAYVHYPTMYSQCGADGFATNLPNYDYLEEQAALPTDLSYNCHYHANVNVPGSCFVYPPNTWVTFYYQVSIGTWGQSNSTIKAWVSIGGQPYVEWINIQNHTLNSGAGLYDLVYLGPYMSYRDSTISAGPTAYTWYDELIVSTQPIAVPNNSGPSGGGTPPTISIVSPVKGATVSGAITVSGTAADGAGVASVQISVDGGPYTAAVGASAWTFNLNTAALSNGLHTITAKAMNASGAAMTDTLSVTVANPPSVPANLAAVAVSSTQINLSWTASTVNGGIAGYKVFRGGVQIATVTAASFSNAGLAPSTTYTYAVSAFDAAGNVSALSASPSATTLPPNAPANPPPVVSPIGFNVVDVDTATPGLQIIEGTSVTYMGSASDPDGDPISWQWLYTVNGGAPFLMASGTGTVQPVTFDYPVGIAPKSYVWILSASDGFSTVQQTLRVDILKAPDTTPPTVPAGLAASAVSATQVNVSWTASTDDAGVAGYQVFRNGVQIATATTVSFTDSGLTPSRSYSYTVSAFDAAGNVSAQSTPAAATTPAGPDTIPPTVSITAPTSGQVAPGLVTIAATAADNVAVAWVQLQVDGVSVGGPVTAPPYAASWDASGLWGSHTLTAVAADTSGNRALSSPVTLVIKRTKVMLSLAAADLAQARLVIETNDWGFPAAPSLTAQVSLPSGVKTLTFNQVASSPLLYAAQASSAAFGAQDFASPASAVVVTVGTSAFAALGQGDALTSALGGAVVDALGSGCLVTVAPGGVTQDAQITINPMPADASGARAAAAKRQNLLLLGPGQDVVFVSSGSLNAASLALPFSASLIPAGLSTAQARIAYFNAATGLWEVQGNATVAGNTVQATVTHLSPYAPVLLMPSAAPGLRNAYVYPDPAVGGQVPVVRAFLGVVDELDVTVFDVAGRKVFNASAPATPTGIANGDYYYDVAWPGAIASGAYFAVIHGHVPAGPTVKARAKFIVVR